MTNLYEKYRNMCLNKLDNKPSPTSAWLVDKVVWCYKWNRITKEEYDDLTNILWACVDPRYEYDRERKVLYDTMNNWEEVKV